jgi:hypothetical protein
MGMKKLEIKDFINYEISAGPSGHLSYLEMVSVPPAIGEPGHGKESFCTIHLALRQQSYETKSYKISSKSDPRQVSSLKKQIGIDLPMMVEHALIDNMESEKLGHVQDMIISLAKENRINGLGRIGKFLYSKFDYLKPFRLTDDVWDLTRRVLSQANKIGAVTRRGNATFALVSPMMFAEFCDTQGIIYEGEGVATLHDRLRIYRSFKLRDMDMIIGRHTKEREPGVHMMEYKGSDAFDSTSENFEGTTFPRFMEKVVGIYEAEAIETSLHTRYALIRTPKAEEQFMHLSFCRTKFPLISFMYNKYFKKKKTVAIKPMTR